MPRFNLTKDEEVSIPQLRHSFNLNKEEDLDLIRVDLDWTKGDLDVQTFCVGKEDQILEDADFVFYNSERRTDLPADGENDAMYINRAVEVPFDIDRFGSKRKWRQHTAPYSFDGSVIGSFDDREGGKGEKIRINLSKVRPAIRKIVITVTVNPTPEVETFRDVENAVVTVRNAQNGDELVSYKVNEEFANETALIAAELINKEGEWVFRAVGEGLDGGLQTLVDTFAS